MKFLFAVALGYLLGSIPTGVLLTRKLKPGLDLRSIGSGNIGATNVSRALGMKWAVLTMLGDCAKGLIPVLFARWIGVSPMGVAITGIAAFLGHVYPIYLQLRGGKGVATALGVLIGIAPATAGLALLIWAAASMIARTTTVGALSASLAIPILVIGTAPPGPLRGPAIFTSLILCPMVFYTHRENIRKLIRGDISLSREPKE